LEPNTGGSIYTGNAVDGADNIDESAVSDKLPPDTDSPSRATRAPSPGPSTELPEPAATADPAAREVIAAAEAGIFAPTLAAEPEESHIAPRELVINSWPRVPRTLNPPERSCCRTPPRTDTPNVGLDTAANLAAAAVFTISTCENESACALTARSTPGSTSGYVAVSPTIVGLGRVDGHVNARDADPDDSVTIGPEPPPENTNGKTEDIGLSVPSALATKFVSTGTHAPDFFTRSGTTDNRAVNVPSGLANTCDDSDVRAVTSTGDPDAAAAANATASGVCATPGLTTAARAAPVAEVNAEATNPPAITTSTNLRIDLRPRANTTGPPVPLRIVRSPPTRSTPWGKENP
jgi:hypothetical protein